MSQSRERTFCAGGLTFKVDYRIFGGDRGPAIRVFADVDGKPVQALRFDCFDDDPHYHFDPSGNDDKRGLPKDQVPDPIAWSLEQVRTRIVEMLETAGCQDAAAQVDAAAVAEIVPQIEAAVREVIPA